MQSFIRDIKKIDLKKKIKQVSSLILLKGQHKDDLEHSDVIEEESKEDAEKQCSASG